ncbi:hypothetical protein Zmor_012557 [Zophobas morio]|uniref:HotDog ACOT-type domain-containing protein n=1 Tax=Zophobas morio TaxID=2755281 RepID=A0AA38IDP2_9CUCU|nr:hypothetical protein Zmor_012557 [Zophobas morio]
MIFRSNLAPAVFKNFGTAPRTIHTVQERKYPHPTPPITPPTPPVIEQLSKTMGRESGYSSIPPSRKHLLQYVPREQNELPPRSLRDSYVEGYIPLSKDLKLQEKYTTFLGSLRIGRLLEDMDYFAVIIAQKHILNPKLPPHVPLPQTLVTARIDKIDFTPFVPQVKEDVKISGHVDRVGRSTMEITVWMGQKWQGSWNRITRAVFLIASRDPTNQKAAVVNPVKPKDDIEKNIIEAAGKRQRLRQHQQQLHISKTRPNDDEQKLIHDLYLKTEAYKRVIHTSATPPSGGVWMEQLQIGNTIFSQPDHRNLHNTVFGGFIMRQATQLSWVLATRFSKHHPQLKHINDIEFREPISVNSLIRMRAFVVFTYMEFVQITVFVTTWQLHEEAPRLTNVLHFTYQVPEFVKQVYPRTYHEAMMYVDGKRHFDEVIKPTPEEKGLLNEEGSLVS